MAQKTHLKTFYIKGTNIPAYTKTILSQTKDKTYTQKNKTFKAPRCKYMPTDDNTVIIFSTKRGKNFEAGFTIGNQDFTLVERGTKEEAQWYCDMLEIAFKTLITPKIDNNIKSEKAKKIIGNLLPKITITNLR
jgi:hypothetical protein